MTDAAPLWRQIAQTLAAEIGPGKLGAGARLPTEAQLASRFDVNRHTIRRAVETLVRAGLVRVEQGRGAFVTEDVLDYAISTRTRFSEWIRRQNREPSGQVLHIRELACPASVAAGLGLDPGDAVTVMERVGLADGVPVSLSSHHFPPQRLPGIEQALRSHPTITAALAAVGVDDYLRQTTRVASRMPSAAEADLLQVARNRPVLVCENTNVDRAGQIVEFGVARYPSTRVQLVFEP
ncbi:MAG: phosphonate metabolism transcriptional regulator PhnF [Acetobacteraceae bacterium]